MRAPGREQGAKGPLEEWAHLEGQAHPEAWDRVGRWVPLAVAQGAAANRHVMSASYDRAQGIALKIRKRIGLHDVRIHDLRRTTASWLAIDGQNLPVIQKVLNHSSLTSTQIYAWLSVEPVRQVLDQHAERILGSLTLVPMFERVAPVTASKVHPDQVQEWPG